MEFIYLPCNNYLGFKEAKDFQLEVILVWCMANVMCPLSPVLLTPMCFLLTMITSWCLFNQPLCWLQQTSSLYF